MIFNIIIGLILLFILTVILLYFIWNKQKLTYKHPKLPQNKIVIPSIIYKTGPKKYKYLDNRLKDNFNLIEEENPGYKVKYYDDNMCRNFIKNNFDTKVLRAYDSLNPGSYKADMFRYCILYIKGGIYGDLSQQYLVPLNKLVDRNRDKLVLVADSFDIFCFKSGIQISFMAAVPKLSVFKDAINTITYNVKRKYYGCSILSPTGPNLFRKCLDRSNIKYRMELEQKGGMLSNMKTGKPVIITKMKNHDSLICQKPKNRYYSMWWSGEIYK